MNVIEQYEAAEDIGLEISRFYNEEKFNKRWSFVYLDGEIEEEPTDNSIDPDMFYANIDKPKRAGVYKTTLKVKYAGQWYDRKVLIIVKDDSHYPGRGAFIYDEDAMKYVNKCDYWH